MSHQYLFYIVEIIIFILFIFLTREKKLKQKEAFQSNLNLLMIHQNKKNQSMMEDKLIEINSQYPQEDSIDSIINYESQISTMSSLRQTVRIEPYLVTQFQKKMLQLKVKINSHRDALKIKLQQYRQIVKGGEWYEMLHYYQKMQQQCRDQFSTIQQDIKDDQSLHYILVQHLNDLYQTLVQYTKIKEKIKNQDFKRIPCNAQIQRGLRNKQKSKVKKLITEQISKSKIPKKSSTKKQKGEASIIYQPITNKLRINSRKYKRTKDDIPQMMFRQHISIQRRII